MSSYRCPLGRMQPEKMDAEKVKRDGFHEDGIVVIDLNKDRLDMVEREIVTQWAERRYGKRRQG